MVVDLGVTICPQEELTLHPHKQDMSQRDEDFQTYLWGIHLTVSHLHDLSIILRGFHRPTCSDLTQDRMNPCLLQVHHLRE